jgi:DNA modification methylase
MSFSRVEHTEHCTLYCGDCLDVLPTLGKVDAVVTDPPYGIGKRLVTGGKSAHFTSMVESGADLWDFKPSKQTFDTLLGMSDSQIIWGGNFFELPPCDKPLCWDKVRPNQKNLSEWEYAWTSLCGRAEKFDYCGNGGFVSAETREHPTQKPVAVMAWSLRFLPNADLILDPYMGSGTTGVACVNTGRRFIGIEKEEKYFEIAIRRIRQAERMAKCDLFKEPKPVERKQLELV